MFLKNLVFEFTRPSLVDKISALNACAVKSLVVTLTYGFWLLWQKLSNQVNLDSPICSETIFFICLTFLILRERERESEREETCFETISARIGLILIFVPKQLNCVASYFNFLSKVELSCHIILNVLYELYST